MNLAPELKNATTWFLRYLESLSNDGEITDETEKLMETFQDAFTVRLTDVCRLVSYFTNRECALRNEAARLEKIARGYAEAASRLRDRVQQAMTLLGLSSCEVPGYKVNVRKSPRKLVCSIDGLAALPNDLCIVERRPNTKAILHLHDTGAPLPQGVDVVQGEHVAIRPA